MRGSSGLRAARPKTEALKEAIASLCGEVEVSDFDRPSFRTLRGTSFRID
jgi:hypothetical protein